MTEYEHLQDIKRRRQRRDQPVYADRTLQADIDALIAMIEGEPTALERGADVDDLMANFAEYQLEDPPKRVEEQR